MEQTHEENACNGGDAQPDRGQERRAAALSAGEHERGNREAFRNFMQDNRQKDYAAQPAGNQKSGGDGHAVKKSVNGQPKQRGDSGVLGNKMLDVRFLSEMEMRRKRVLKKMNDEISDQHQEIREVSRQGHRFGKNLQNRRGQHEARAEREKIFQVLARPL